MLNVDLPQSFLSREITFNQLSSQAIVSIHFLPKSIRYHWEFCWKNNIFPTGRHYGAVIRTNLDSGQFVKKVFLTICPPTIHNHLVWLKISALITTASPLIYTHTHPQRLSWKLSMLCLFAPIQKLLPMPSIFFITHLGVLKVDVICIANRQFLKLTVCLQLDVAYLLTLPSRTKFLYEFTPFF